MECTDVIPSIPLYSHIPFKGACGAIQVNQRFRIPN